MKNWGNLSALLQFPNIKYQIQVWMQKVTIFQGKEFLLFANNTYGTTSWWLLDMIRILAPMLDSNLILVGSITRWKFQPHEQFCTCQAHKWTKNKKFQNSYIQEKESMTGHSSNRATNETKLQPWSETQKLYCCKVLVGSRDVPMGGIGASCPHNFKFSRKSVKSQTCCKMVTEFSVTFFW